MQNDFEINYLIILIRFHFKILLIPKAKILKVGNELKRKKYRKKGRETETGRIENKQITIF